MGDLDAYNSSTANISGGNVDYLEAYNSSCVGISGGNVGNLSAYNSSVANISGGNVGNLEARDYSVVGIPGGKVSHLYTYNSSVANISGGNVSALDAYNWSVVGISGGVFNYLYIVDSSTVDISGGSVGILDAGDSSTVIFHGRGFLASGTLYLDGERVLGLGTLSGEWMDGTPWVVDIERNYPTATILAVSGLATYYVNAQNGNDNNNGWTPGTAFATIQKGIDSAEDGGIVTVLPGAYRGDGNRDLDFKSKAITVRSTDPNDPNIVAATIIDCNGTKEYPHRGFYFHTGEDANSILEGLTITNGYGPNEPWGENKYSLGGAVFCKGASPTVRNCVFVNNYSNFCGGGVYCDDSSATFSNCTFKENKSFDTGGGLYNRLSEITVTKCLFIGNSAVAGGGMYNVDGDPTVRNSIFVGNLASLKGGAVRNNRVTATLTNCTFFDNQAPEGGAIHNIDSWGILTNCILWKNPNTEIEGTAIVSYCDVMGGWPDEGNIDTDPLFADANEGDFHLRSQIGRWDPRTKSWVQDSETSRCIDAGDPNDPVGYEPNPNGDRINQGAYGGTAEASKSPYCAETLLSDLNHDCRVDFIDFAIFVSEWLYQIKLIRADFIHGNKHKLESSSCCPEIHNQASSTAASRSSIVGYSRLLNFLCLN